MSYNRINILLCWRLDSKHATTARDREAHSFGACIQ